MELRDVTQSNYYDDKVQNTFMSATVFKRYLQCEAKAVAVACGQYKEFSNDSALVYGNVVHSYFEGSEAHNRFIEDHHSDLYTKTTNKPNAEFKKAKQAIEALENDTTFKRYYMTDGNEYEKIVTGKIYPNIQGNIFSENAPDGVDWIGKLDMVNHKKHIIGDIKTNARPFANYDGFSFIEKYGYDIQMAIYQELYRVMTGELYQPVIFMVGKQNYQTQAVSIPQSLLNDKLELVKDNEERFYDLMKEVLENPEQASMDSVPCETCDYCISQERKRARDSGIISLDEFDKLLQ